MIGGPRRNVGLFGTFGDTRCGRRFRSAAQHASGGILFCLEYFEMKGWVLGK